MKQASEQAGKGRGEKKHGRHDGKERRKGKIAERRDANDDLPVLPPSLLCGDCLTPAAQQKLGCGEGLAAIRMV